MGWTTCSDARVDGIAEDVATSTLATQQGGMMTEGDTVEGSVELSGRSGDVGR